MKEKYFIEVLKKLKVSSIEGFTAVKQIQKVYWHEIGGLQLVKVCFQKSLLFFFSEIINYFEH